MIVFLSSKDLKPIRTANASVYFFFNADFRTFFIIPFFIKSYMFANIGKKIYLINLFPDHELIHISLLAQ